MVRALTRIEWVEQQASEKAVKAVLIHSGIDFPMSHRLDRLAGLIPASREPGFDIAALAELAPWAVAGRYPEDSPNPTATEAGHIVELAQAAVSFFVEYDRFDCRREFAVGDRSIEPARYRAL